MEENNQTSTEPQWLIEDDDKEFGIETKRYDNGQIMKRCKLSDGRIAVVRRLKGVDANEIRRLTGQDEKNYQNAVTAKCTTIDDKPVLIEEIQDVWMNDYTTISMMAAINFPSTPNA